MNQLNNKGKVAIILFIIFIIVTIFLTWFSPSAKDAVLDTMCQETTEEVNTI